MPVGDLTAFTTYIVQILMGLSTTVVLLFSNMLISALRKIIPDRVRIPAYIVVVATLVTIVQLLLEAYVPSLYSALGIYIPLIVVNCIILGRAESYASKNGVMESTFDGIGMGLGFTVALTCIGLVRELLGSGAIFGYTIIPEDFHISIFVLAPGAFFVLSILTALQNKFKAPSATNGSSSNSELACGGNCAACTGSSCMRASAVVYDRAHSSIATATAANFDFDEIFKDADWFHFTGITPAVSDEAAELTEAALKAAKAHGVTVSVDLNFRKKLWSSEKAQRVMTNLMQYVDVCIGNEEDAEKVLGFKPGNTDVTSGELELQGYVDIFNQMIDKFNFKYVISSLRESYSASDNGWSAWREPDFTRISAVGSPESVFPSKRVISAPISRHT